MTLTLEIFTVFQLLSQNKQRAEIEKKGFLLTVICHETKQIWLVLIRCFWYKQNSSGHRHTSGPSLAECELVLSPILHLILVEGKKYVCIQTIIFAAFNQRLGINDPQWLWWQPQISSGDSLLQMAGESQCERVLPNQSSCFYSLKKNKKKNITNCPACDQLCSLTIFLHPSITFCSWSPLPSSCLRSSFLLQVATTWWNIVVNVRLWWTRTCTYAWAKRSVARARVQMRIRVRAHVGLCHFLQSENTWEHYRCLLSLFLSPSHCDSPRSSSALPSPLLHLLLPLLLLKGAETE